MYCISTVILYDIDNHSYLLKGISKFVLEDLKIKLGEQFVCIEVHYISDILNIINICKSQKYIA
ncbi:hypothetical protein AA106555_1872 [Neokomagataea thailandica NBRC 106555]|uniref:Uncharacterized protein n=1 Tax=Neokomagataea thailandica NBRC 106555 TaxID=1223520 RepID=A0ABQ0QSA0_9PROT|nr:hypothetical protein AA106555_1872 [Neokomagataea thailandica NBRC 106555]